MSDEFLKYFLIAMTTAIFIMFIIGMVRRRREHDHDHIDHDYSRYWNLNRYPYGIYHGNRARRRF